MRWHTTWDKLLRLKDSFTQLPDEVDEISARCVCEVGLTPDGKQTLSTDFWVFDLLGRQGELLDQWCSIAHRGALFLSHARRGHCETIWLHFLCCRTGTHFKFINMKGDLFRALRGRVTRLRSASIVGCDFLLTHMLGEYLRVQQPKRLPGVTAGNRRNTKNPRQGNVHLLGDKLVVNFSTAAQYAGRSEDWLRRLGKKGSLAVVGKGHSQKVTAESLKSYFPPTSER